MNAAEYKRYHESFMQNNHGSTPFHVFCCILFTVLCATYVSIKPRWPFCFQYIYEYLIIVLPLILVHTTVSEYIYVFTTVISIILLYEVFFYVQGVSKKYSQQNIFPHNRVPLISLIRGLTYLITVLCILAVDFKSFPRYLAKTEKYGYSLMDTGVGLFVLVSGLVHKDLQKHNLKQVLKSNVKIILILLILGVGRYVSVKQLEYQEHVTEYGVHWNFFFTIAACKLISTVLLLFSNRALLLSVITLIIHELFLYISLHDWVFGNSPRDSLISANREGISSCLGYVSLYLFGVHMKQIFLSQKVTKLYTQLEIICTAFILCILSYLVNIILPTSRTLANAGYCLYMNAVFMTVSVVLYFILVLVNDKDIKIFQMPIILSSINSNGLNYFLISNLLTGAINLSMRTLLVSDIVTFVILNVYMIVTIVCINLLKRLGVKL